MVDHIEIETILHVYCPAKQYHKDNRYVPLYACCFCKYRDLTTPNIDGCINCKYEDLNKAYRKTIDKDGRL